MFLRAYVEETQTDDPNNQPDDQNRPVRFTASTEGIKRDGKDLKLEDWDLSRFQRHPVVLWVHDVWGQNLPLGRAELSFENRSMMADVYYDTDDPFALRVRGKARKRLVAMSVQWDEVERNGRIVNELMEVSNVPVPLDPDALPVRQQRGLAALRDQLDSVLRGLGEAVRRAHPPHSTPKAAEEAAWDGPGEVAQAEGAEQLWRMHTWRDDDLDPETKQAYKLPHHLHTGEVVWRGVAAAMGRLFQADTQIPEADRRGCYNHLARHYQQFDREPPEFRSRSELAAIGPDLVRGLFLEGEPGLWPDVFGRGEEPPAEQSIAVDPVLMELHRIFAGG